MKDLIIFGEDWGGHPSTAQFIAKELLRKNKCRILWVDSLGQRVPHIDKKDVGRMINKIINFLAGLKNPTNNLFVFTPLLIPLQKYPIIRAFNGMLLRLYIKYYIKKLHLKGFTLMLAGPLAEPVIGKLGEDKSVYYCADEYGTMPGVSELLIEESENRLSKKISNVIVVSKNLLEHKRKLYSNIDYIPHGVDYHHFSKTLSDNTIINERMKSFDGPVLGYHGLIQDLIDIDLLEMIAENKPDWNIVLIGKVIFNATRIPRKPNIYLLGEKPFSEIPSYIKRFDVGLIPYKITKRTLFANPIKLREYLAAGIPVVSTDLPEVSGYSPHVKIGKNANEFVTASEDFIKNANVKLKKARAELMQEESWNKISERIFMRL